MCDHLENRTAHAGQNKKPEVVKNVPVEFSDDAASAFAKAMKQLFENAARNQAAAPKPPKLKNRHGCPPNQP
jgi:hypothetical protein